MRDDKITYSTVSFVDVILLKNVRCYKTEQQRHEWQTNRCQTQLFERQCEVYRTFVAPHIVQFHVSGTFRHVGICASSDNSLCVCGCVFVCASPTAEVEFSQALACDADSYCFPAVDSNPMIPGGGGDVILHALMKRNYRLLFIKRPSQIASRKLRDW